MALFGKTTLRLSLCLIPRFANDSEVYHYTWRLCWACTQSDDGLLFHYAFSKPRSLLIRCPVLHIRTLRRSKEALSTPVNDWGCDGRIFLNEVPAWLMKKKQCSLRDLNGVDHNATESSPNLHFPFGCVAIAVRLVCRYPCRQIRKRPKRWIAAAPCDDDQPWTGACKTSGRSRDRS